MEYRKDIDGLRAVAILPVIAFHLRPEAFSAGFVGVDIFFVISGFLMSNLIIAKIDLEEFSFREFFARRVQRLLPAATTIVLLVILISPFLSLSSMSELDAIHGVAALFFSLNFVMWKTGGYWEPAAEESPFLHYWSLSLEEQFYIIFPVFLWLVARYAKKHYLFLLFVSCLLSFALNCFFVSAKPNATFYLLPSRAWELLMGAIVGVIMMRYGSKKYAAICSVTGAILLICAFTFVTSQGFPGFSALLPTVGTALILYGGNHTKYIFKALSMKWLRYIGILSYSLYLCHWPIIVFIRRYESLNAVYVPTYFIIIKIVLCTLFLHYFVEKPFRYRKLLVPKIGLGIAVVVSVCVVYFLGNKFDENNLNKVTRNIHKYDNSPADIREVKEDMERAEEWGIVTLGVEAVFEEISDDPRVSRHRAGEELDILVFGDSHAVMWSAIIDKIASENQLNVGFCGASGSDPCFTSLNQRERRSVFKSQNDEERFDKMRLRALKREVQLIIVAARWSWHKHSEEELRKLFERLSSNGARIVIIDECPILTFGNHPSTDYYNYLRRSGRSTTWVPYILNEDIRNAKKTLQKVASEQNTWELVSADSKLLGATGTKFKNGRDLLYIDDDHLSYQGTLFCKEIIESYIRELELESK